jgi:hypothetical protein
MTLEPSSFFLLQVVTTLPRLHRQESFLNTHAALDFDQDQQTRGVAEGQREAITARHNPTLLRRDARRALRLLLIQESQV